MAGVNLDNWTLIYAFSGSVSLVASSMLLLRWWRHLLTSSMVAISMALLLALLPAILHLMLGVSLTTRWFDWYRNSSLALIGTVEFWRTWVVWLEQRPKPSRHKS